MSRTTRTILVIAVATVMATVATLAVYAAVSRIPVREVEVASLKVVVAVHKLPTGARLAEKDLKLVAWPTSSPLPGAFDKIEDGGEPRPDRRPGRERADHGEQARTARVWRRPAAVDSAGACARCR